MEPLKNKKKYLENRQKIALNGRRSKVQIAVNVTVEVAKISFFCPERRNHDSRLELEGITPMEPSLHGARNHQESSGMQSNIWVCLKIGYPKNPRVHHHFPCEVLKIGHKMGFNPSPSDTPYIRLVLHMYIYISIYLTIYLSVYLSIYPSIYLGIYLFNVNY